MTKKRALIVDDSRSARVILSRMLEAYDLEVDAAESAELALEYLRQSRPDVIFMDHLMPGMDGFQAIQAIKSNPDTAMIPVMMYTSQEGELYVSQARALGAVGVLPKTVKQGDVSRVLYQLRLLPERREERTPLFAHESETAEQRPAGSSRAQAPGIQTARVQPTGAQNPRTQISRVEPPGHAAHSQPAYAQIADVQMDRPGSAIVGEIEMAVRNAIAPALKEHSAELRRYIAASLEVLARRIAAEHKTALPAPASAPEFIVEPQAPAVSRATMGWPLVAAISAIAILPTVVLAVLYTLTLQNTQALIKSNAHLAAFVEEQQSQLTTLQQAARNAAVAAVDVATASASRKVEREIVPYGEAPLAGARLERLRDLVAELKASDFHGKLKVATYVGEFCLTGNGIEGYSMAADDLPVKRCDLVGNPFDDSLTNAQRQSLGFANLISSVGQQTGNAVTIEVANSGRLPSIAYPEGDGLAKATAGEWNRVAMQNNRVEFVPEAVGE